MLTLSREHSEFLLSSDSMATLLTVKNMCVHHGHTARKLAHTKENRVILRCQHKMRAVHARKCDVTLHHEQSYHALMATPKGI